VAALGVLVFRALVMLMLVGAYYLMAVPRAFSARRSFSLVSVPANDRVTIVLLLLSGVPSSASRDRGIGLPEIERASPTAFCKESERVALFGASSLADRIPSKMPRVQTTTNDGRTRLAFSR
jgi:hypothetical protein